MREIPGKMWSVILKGFSSVDGSKSNFYDEDDLKLPLHNPETGANATGSVAA